MDNSVKKKTMKTDKFVREWQIAALNLLEHERSLYVAVRDMPTAGSGAETGLVMVNVAAMVPEADADALMDRINDMVGEVIDGSELTSDLFVRLSREH